VKVREIAGARSGAGDASPPPMRRWWLVLALLSGCDEEDPGSSPSPDGGTTPLPGGTCDGARPPAPGFPGVGSGCGSQFVYIWGRYQARLCTCVSAPGGACQEGSCLRESGRFSALIDDEPSELDP
jgi:hypothetical protein